MRTQLRETVRIGGAPGRRNRAAFEGGSRRCVPLIVENQIHLQAVRRLPFQEPPQRQGLGTIECLGWFAGVLGFGASIDILDETVALLVGERKAPTRGVTQRAADMAARPALGVVAQPATHAAFECFSRPRRNHFDGTDGGARTKQCGLRTLQHFHPLQVEQFDDGAARAADIDPVLVDGHSRCDTGRATVRGNATNNKAGIVDTLFLHHQPRNEVRKPIKLFDIQRVEKVAAVGSQGDGHLLRALLAFLGGDAHLFKAHTLGTHLINTHTLGAGELRDCCGAQYSESAAAPFGPCKR